MSEISILERGWRKPLSELVSGASDRLLIAAPFVTLEGAKLVLQHMSPRLRERGRVHVFTDLSPTHVCDGSLEPAALSMICDAATSPTLWHIPKLHAKVYAADNGHAIVTSGNLTSAALFRNLEFGVDIRNEMIVRAIVDRFGDFEATATIVTREQLVRFEKAAAHVRETFERQRQSANVSLRRAFLDAMQTAEDDLVRLRLAGGAMHTVFARTVIFLLKKHGSMETPKIHEFIQELHPDLCDDSVDRVIDGKHFGKKWKHAVRTAQQQLKKSGEATYENGLWRSLG